MRQASIRLATVCCVSAFAAAAGPSDAAARTAAPREAVVEAAGGTSQTDDGITMTQVDAGGFTFDVRIAGPDDGEVVILLHGFPQTSYEWRHQLRALGEAGFRAVAPDQRGYSPGARPPRIEDYALPLLVGDVIGVADALGADRFHVVGHDWGAVVAWALAIAAQDRVITANPVSVPHPDAFARVLSAADPGARRGPVPLRGPGRRQPLDSRPRTRSDDLAAPRPSHPALGALTPRAVTPGGGCRPRRPASILCSAWKRSEVHEVQPGSSLPSAQRRNASRSPRSSRIAR